MYSLLLLPSPIWNRDNCTKTANNGNFMQNTQSSTNPSGCNIQENFCVSISGMYALKKQSYSDFLAFCNLKLREVVKKNTDILGQADRKGCPPPPLRSAVLCFFLRCTFDFCFWLYMIWNKFWQKNVFWPFVWPFGCVKMSISNRSKHYNGTKNAMKGSALDMHF